MIFVIKYTTVGIVGIAKPTYVLALMSAELQPEQPNARHFVSLHTWEVCLLRTSGIRLLKIPSMIGSGLRSALHEVAVSTSQPDNNLHSSISSW